MNLKTASNVKCIFSFLHLSELCFVNTNDLNKTITINDTIDHDLITHVLQENNNKYAEFHILYSHMIMFFLESNQVFFTFLVFS